VSETRRPFGGYLAAAGSALAAGSCVVPGKLGLSEIPALPFCFYLFLFATPMTGAWMVSVRGLAPPPRGADLRLLLLHVALSSAAIAGFWGGIALLNPAVASFLNRTEVLVAVLLGVVFLRERLGGIEWLGAAVAVAGVVLMKVPAEGAGALEGEGLGFLLVLLGSVFFGLTELVSKLAVARIPVTVFAFYRNALLVPVFGAAALLSSGLPPLDLRTAGLLLLAAILAPNVARILYFMALRRLSLSRAALVSQSQPLFAAALTLAVLGEGLRPVEWAGGAAILLGCALLVLGRRDSRTTAGCAAATPRG
jgi:drug/metabolite transporter (DMT)-like permease